MPAFSVIIPTYNSEKFIEDTISSVLDQTLPDFELIIIDDGSKDSTRSILDTYKARDSRIKVITTPNSGGPATPTNIGINVATGRYIAFLDHDDSWLPHKLELLSKTFEENDDVGFILSNIKIHDENNNSFSFAKAPVHNNSLSLHNLLSGNYFNTFSMLSVKKSILERVGSIDTNLAVFPDYDIIARLVSYNVPHFFIEEPLVTYRVHQHNTSSMVTSSRKRIADLERITTKYSKMFAEHARSLSKIYQAIGRIYLNLGDRKRATSYFILSAKNDPYNPAAYIRLLSSFFGEIPYRVFRKIKNETLRKI